MGFEKEMVLSKKAILSSSVEIVAVTFSASKNPIWLPITSFI